MEAHPSLHEGCNFEPIYKLLNSKKNDSEWNATLMGMLRSIVANRQFPQSRCYQAAWVQHPKCIFCLHAEVSGQKLVATLGSGQASEEGGSDGQSRQQQQQQQQQQQRQHPPGDTNRSGSTICSGAPQPHVD